MLRIAVVEDNLRDFATIKSHFQKFQEECNNRNEFTIVHFKSALNFLDQYDSAFDMIFMDIKLPDIDGIEAAKRLRRIDEDVLLILVTNMAQFAVNGYEVWAFDYMVKPVSYPTFILKLGRALSSLSKKRGTVLRVSVQGGFVALNTNDIKFIETSGHNLVYHAKDKKYSSRGSIKEVEKLLPSNFKKCNRCYIVNLNYVTRVYDVFVYLDDVSLQISQHKRAEFIHAVNEWFNNTIGG